MEEVPCEENWRSEMQGRKRRKTIIKILVPPHIKYNCLVCILVDYWIGKVHLDDRFDPLVYIITTSLSILTSLDQNILL